MNSMEKRLRDDLASAMFEYRQTDVEVKRLQVAMDKLRIRIDYIGGVLGRDEQAGTSGPAPHRGSAQPVNGEAHGEFTGKPAAQVIEAVLREAGKKLELKQIVRSAIAGGYAAEGEFKKVRANFSSLLTRASAKPEGKFKKESRGIFLLAN